MALVDIIMLVRNEEKSLPASLAAVAQVRDFQLTVVDSGSSDKSAELCELAGARVVTNKWINYATQFNWALKNCRLEGRWILRLDADEVLDPELIRFLNDGLPVTPDSVVGYEIALRVYFRGKLLRWGGAAEYKLLRLWRRGHGWCEERNMDEHISVEDGDVVLAPGFLRHHIADDLGLWISKHVGYARREALDCAACKVGAVLHGNSGERRRRKERWYLRSPLFLRAIAYWVYRYLLKLGFLDGRQGFIYHFFQALWYRMMVDAIIWDIGRKED